MHLRTITLRVIFPSASPSTLHDAIQSFVDEDRDRHGRLTEYAIRDGRYWLKVDGQWGHKDGYEVTLCFDRESVCRPSPIDFVKALQKVEGVEGVAVVAIYNPFE